MRVIGGEYRSRALKSVAGLDVRPTPDRLRESLFNILAGQLEGTIFVDAYAGTGAVGIEALSRGARHAVFIEKNRAALAVLRENLQSLGAARRAEVVGGNAATAVERYREADIVFLDPPYPLEREYAACLANLGADPPALVIVQHASRFRLAETYGRLRRYRLLKQGDNCLSFFRPDEDGE